MQAFSSLSIMQPIAVATNAYVLFVREVFTPFFIFYTRFFVQVGLSFNLATCLGGAFVMWMGGWDPMWMYKMVTLGSFLVSSFAFDSSVGSLVRFSMVT